MTPVPRLKRGQIVKVDGRKAIVLKVGRSQCYSAVVRYQVHELVAILTEVPFWLDQGAIEVVKEPNPHNVRWAKDFCKSHLIPDV